MYIHILQQILSSQFFQITLTPWDDKHQQGTSQTTIESPTCHFLDGGKRSLHLYFSLDRHSCHFLSLSITFSLIFHTIHCLIVSIGSLNARTVEVLRKPCYIILLAMLKYIGVESRTDTWSNDHTHGKHDADPSGHKPVRHTLVGYRGDKRIEQHHSRRTDDDRPLHAFIHTIILYFEIHIQGIGSNEKKAQRVHPLEVYSLRPGYYGKDQAHSISHHHPVAQGGILPIVYLHTDIGEDIDKHRTGIAHHQEEEKHDAIIDDSQLKYLHYKIRRTAGQLQIDEQAREDDADYRRETDRPIIKPV